MPEHVHVVVHPIREEYDMGKFLYAVKFPVTYRSKRFVVPVDKCHDALRRVIREVKESSTFWQSGPGYDRNLWTEKEIREKLEYIHNNPVKRGLCDTRSGWEWSSAGNYEGRSSGRLKITRVSFI